MAQNAPVAAKERRGTLALACAAILAFTLSLAGSALKSTIQVYFSSIAHGLNADLGVFAWSTTSFAIVIAIASPVVGAMADRFGGAAILVTGSVLAGTTFLVCAAVPSVLLFAPTYGVVGALSFTMMSYVPLGKLADELFAERGEGLAYAVMTNGPAVGFITLVPLWVWVGSFVSWRPIFVAAGVVMLAVLTPLALLLKRLAAEDGDAEGGGHIDIARPGFREQVSFALRDRSFVTLAIAFTGCGVTMAFVDVHLVTDLDMAGMQSSVVSGSLSLLGAFEILGALIAGRQCDRGRLKQTLVTGYALRGTAMLMLAFTPTTATSLIFGVVFGASYMVTVVATSIWV
ncbi:MAG: MFS transporter, partial [Frankia sp.]